MPDKPGWTRVGDEEARRVMENADWAMAVLSGEVESHPTPDGKALIVLRLTIAHPPGSKAEVPRTEKLLLTQEQAVALADLLRKASR